MTIAERVIQRLFFTLPLYEKILLGLVVNSYKGVPLRPMVILFLVNIPPIFLR